MKMSSIVRILRNCTKYRQYLSQRNYYNLKFIKKYQHNLRFYNDNSLDTSIIIKRWIKDQKFIKCWQCGIERRNINELFCEKCNIIQQPYEKCNYFKIFEFNEEYDVDLKELTKKYRQLQSVLHPDKFSNKSDQEKQISAEFSSLINKAYNNLQSPLKRAIHLLNLRGERIEEDQSVNDDPEFLMEIMEVNEEVENADSPEKLIKLNNHNREILKQIESNINNCFKNNEIIKAKQQIIKMKYYNSIKNHINSLMRDKGIVE